MSEAEPSGLNMFERDADQSGVPTDHTALILRHWSNVIEGGSVCSVRMSLVNGLLALEFDGRGGDVEERCPRFRGEPSRLFVRNDAEIDPAVFTLKAGPVPHDLEPDDSE